MFSYNLTLQESPNDYELILTDKNGAKQEEKFKITLDTVNPELFPDTIRTTVYKGDLEITGKFNEPNMKSVTLQPGDRPLGWEYSDGVVSVRVPELRLHAMIVIDLAS